MNRINIQREDGFPVQRRTFDFLQDAFGSAIEHLCRVHGDNLILHGAVVGGTTISAGAVVINGELLPFEQSFIGGGGTQNARIEIVERTEPVIYQSGELLPAYVTRVARIGVGGTIPFSALRRIPRPRAQTEWVNCEPTTNITVVEQIQCRINEKGKVELRGRYWHGGDWGFMWDIMLPAGFIPSHNRQELIVQVGESPNTATIRILPNGRVMSSIPEVMCNQDFVFNISCEFDL